MSPVKNLSSQITHWELTLKVMENSFWRHSVTSHDDSQCELAVSFPWVCNSRGKLVVSFSWDYPGEVIMFSLWQLQTHIKLTATSQFEHNLWVHCELTEWMRLWFTIIHLKWQKNIIIVECKGWRHKYKNHHKYKNRLTFLHVLTAISLVFLSLSS